MSQFFQLLIYGLQLGTIYALVALGYTMVYGIVNLLHSFFGFSFLLSRARPHSWARMAHRSLADLALKLRLHSSAPGLITSLDTSS